jgi:hypothetical protein
VCYYLLLLAVFAVLLVSRRRGLSCMRTIPAPELPENSWRCLCTGALSGACGSITNVLLKFVDQVLSELGDGVPMRCSLERTVSRWSELL